MLTRRQAITSLPLGAGSALVGSRASFAQIAAAVPNDAGLVPNEQGLADFAQAWELIEGTEVGLVAAAPDIPPGFAEAFSQSRLTNAAAINSEISKRRNSYKTFNSWFNGEVAKKGAWVGKSILGSERSFDAFWNGYLRLNPLTLMEVLTYMAVFVNEVEGRFESRSENYGSPGHPGISYLFDVVVFNNPTTGREWRKQSYNTYKGNLTALALFSDPNYNATHGNLPLAQRLKGTTDPVWASSKYPQDQYPSSGDPAVDGYILEADFFKFRGRGLIQTTGRDNYRALVVFIKSFGQANSLITKYRTMWNGIDNDVILTESTCAQWDEIFDDQTKIILCQAIRAHADAGKYLPLSHTTNGINGVGRSSVSFFGDRLGGSGYGQRLKRRMVDCCDALGL